jgi:GcrA cell cycle regulator|nr:GcrA family cell cycle regulator [uncultured Rhodopila sp.]
MGSNPERTPWNEDRVGTLRRLWHEGHTTAEIGRRLRVSKNAIVGKAHRLDLEARPDPIRRSGRTKQRPDPSLPPVAKAPGIRRLAAASVATCAPARPKETKPAAARAAAVQRLAPPKRPWEPCRPLRIGTASCCWPIGEPGTRTFRFCDDRALAGKPYCLEHAKLAYRPKPSSTERERADEWQASSVP